MSDTQLVVAIEQALASMNQDEMIELLCDIDPVTWTEHRRMLKGQPFSFKDRDYLLDIYRDQFQDIIVFKGRQVEMSEFSMNWLLNKLDAHPYTAGLHSFPREKQCLRFSKQRLDGAIKDSRYLGDWYETRESEILMRKFVKSEKDMKPYNFYLLGATWESRKDTVGDASRGISLDFIVYDERQDHPNDVETVLGEGASHSEFKQTLTLGTPKLPGIQFDQQWENSDKRYWHVKCEHCNNEEPITMDNIMDSGDDEVGYIYVCRKCKSLLNRNLGKWRATRPQKRPQYRGYHINQLMVCWLSANEIMKKKNSTTYPRRRFHNEVLGESYGGDDIPITWAMMEACARSQHRLGDNEGQTVYVGVDWGGTSYALLQTKDHILVDVVIADDKDPREHPKTIAKKLAQYKPYVRRVVCDAGPDITRYYNLRDELIALGVTKDVWACYYATPPAKTDTTWNEKERNVTVGRSEMIEQLIDEISNQAFFIPQADINIERVDEMMEHFTNIAAEKTENKSGNQFIMYVNTGPDHFLHAKIYSDVASGGSISTSIGGSAPPIQNMRPNIRQQITPSGIILPSIPTSKVSGIFPIFNMNKKRRL